MKVYKVYKMLIFYRSNATGQCAFCEIERRKYISSVDEAEAVAEAIRKSDNDNSITITGYKLLKIEKRIDINELTKS